MNNIHPTLSIALALLVTAGCRAVAPQPTPSAGVERRTEMSDRASRTTLSIETLEAIRRLLGIDGNGIDIRPLLAAPEVNLVVEYAAWASAGASSPWESNTYRLTNRSKQQLEVTIPLAAGSIKRTIAPGAWSDITYEIRANNRALWLENDNEDKLVDSDSAKYKPDSHFTPPFSKRRREGAPLELVVNVFGYVTVLSIVFK